MSEALKLADQLENFRAPFCDEAAAELRRLAAVEQELVAARKQMEAQKDEWLSWEAKRKGLEQAALELETLKRAISDAEPVAVIGPAFQMLWTRQIALEGLHVGDALYTLKGIK